MKVLNYLQYSKSHQQKAVVIFWPHNAFFFVGEGEGEVEGKGKDEGEGKGRGGGIAATHGQSVLTNYGWMVRPC